MRARFLALPATGVGALLLLALPDARVARGASAMGSSLGLQQRDFRIHDSFKDSASNDNQTPDPNFPGYTGAEMAIWKGCIEWGSELHGDGQGDPHQPGGLGSGEANFDPSFQGNAGSPGPPNSNIHSTVSGCGAGLLAYTELPIANGWRIRYCDGGWTFSDGPGVFIGGNKDIQGTAAHEYGHALGLPHLSDPSATMASGIVGSGVDARSIEASDIAAIQGIYGPRSPQKPSITGYNLNGQDLTVFGTGFSATNNEVWFTLVHAGHGGDGQPVRVTGLASSGGAIDLVVPETAGAGDVLVKIEGGSHSSLSNAWPFTGAAPTCGATQYGLGASPANIATLSTSQTPQGGASFTMNLSGYNGSGNALLLVCPQPSYLPMASGLVLIEYKNPFITSNVSIVDGAGSLTLTLPPVAATGYLQSGMADPSQTSGWSFSNGLEVSICL